MTAKKLNKDYRDDKIAIIIPAYNESENISVLLGKISTALPRGRIVIVDDSSPRENQKIREFIKNRKNITLVSRNKKQGRGSAVIAGLKEALTHKNIELFFEMDADLSHNPDEVKTFLDFTGKADMLIGSRYLDKSQIKDWPLRRLIPSKIINYLLNLIFALNLTDYTNGFRLYNKKTVHHLTRTELKEKGFISLTEISYKLHRAGFTIREVPISFVDRQKGKSNADMKEHWRSICGVLRIRFYA